MARIKYYYDTETCKYERIKTRTSDVISNLLGFLAVAFLIALAIVPVYNSYFKSSREAALHKENEELRLYYTMLSKEMKQANDMLASLQDRDDNVYRVIFEAEPVASSVRSAGVGGSERYKDLLEKGLDQEEMILDAFKKVDKLKKQMYVQTKSYDDILKFAKNKAHMWASIPAVQPVSNKELKRLASGYGMRIHPIYKVKRMHTGIDFSATRGTPIYATGDGVVTIVRSNLGGYGKEVQIDHGYGYITLYAHMENFNVKAGQKIKRGECIGYVGSTGSSTAPHLHYEVIHNGSKVNPVHFFFNELTPGEYEKILEMASVENQSMS
ncbi:M23 family metallopeptidase [Rhodocytophaga rosea]|uniref:M23 family metallopeptidase n=1 Tax=Rhodocytophaga rosea TaxID=2704465 RepID=A0A6C0GI72_9BACT|nr:M23 family metallopeptidase [Rhodocytophaga rosea]QHT67524.1 M23 family metallopeptidase [Rhodocytophaga rosea]